MASLSGDAFLPLGGPTFAAVFFDSRGCEKLAGRYDCRRVLLCQCHIIYIKSARLTDAAIGS